MHSSDVPCSIPTDDLTAYTSATITRTLHALPLQFTLASHRHPISSSSLLKEGNTDWNTMTRN